MLVFAPSLGFAQEAPPPSLPPGWITPTPKGLVAERALLRKLVSTLESTIGAAVMPFYLMPALGGKNTIREGRA